MGAIAKDIIEVSSLRSIFGTLLLRVRSIKSEKPKIIRDFAGGRASAQTVPAARTENRAQDLLMAIWM
jgi:hypothetical protein